MQLGQYRVAFHHEDNSRIKDYYVTVPVVNPVTTTIVDVMLLVESPESFTECKLYQEVEGEASHNLDSIKLSEKEDKWYVCMATGIAKLHKGDIYNKETGRRLSLARALADLDVSKDERAEVWEAYRTSTGSEKVRWALPKPKRIKPSPTPSI